MSAASNSAQQQVASLEKELQMMESAEKTRPAAEALVKFIQEHQATDSLAMKQPDNPYATPAKGQGGGCCIIA
jgi:hypothetical protein